MDATVRQRLLDRGELLAGAALGGERGGLGFDPLA